jgi:hypothetical protein
MADQPGIKLNFNGDHAAIDFLIDYGSGEFGITLPGRYLRSFGSGPTDLAAALEELGTAFLERASEVRRLKGPANAPSRARPATDLTTEEIKSISRTLEGDLNS